MYVIPDLLMRKVEPAAPIGIIGSGVAFDVCLFTNNFTPDKNSILANFTELTNVQVPGYARGLQLLPASPSGNRGPSGNWRTFESGNLFQATGVVPAPITVYGWFFIGLVGGALLGSGLFDVPFVFNSQWDGFFLAPVLWEVGDQDGQSLLFTLPNFQPVL